MKHFLLAGAAAVTLMALSGSQASAWSKANFGFGFNIGFESANNNVLWGLCKSGPACGGEPYFGPQGCGGGQPYFPPMTMPPPIPAPKEEPKKTAYGDYTGVLPYGTQQVGYSNYPAQGYGYYYPAMDYSGYGYPVFWYGR